MARTVSSLTLPTEAAWGARPRVQYYSTPGGTFFLSVCVCCVGLTFVTSAFFERTGFAPP